MKTSTSLFCADVNTGSIINEISTNILIPSTDGYVQSSHSLMVRCVDFQVFRVEQSLHCLYVAKLRCNVERGATL